ncbi:hypothetical protein KJ903_02930 [Patescibacteria group bacterium]|nr:hypothetical protein [Patescibacteria group bacterium]
MKKRHELIYEVTIGISVTETQNAIKSAADLVKKIKKEIQQKNPQKRLL